MRWLPGSIAMCVLCTAHTGHAEPLADVVVRVGAGLATGGGAGRAAMRAAPVVATVDGAYLVREQPNVWGFAGLTLETGDRTGVGLEAGLAVDLGRATRARVGARSIARPYTLHGATLGLAWCGPRASVRGCVDLAADVYVAGTDLPAGNAVAQLLLSLGVGFDVL